MEVASTAGQLVAFIQQNAPHIQIVEHLDLTALGLISSGFCNAGCESPLPALKGTKSIRGNCSTAPPESMLERLRRAELPTAAVKDLIGLRPGQCLLISYEDLMPVDTPRVWIDNLYLRTVTALPGFLATPSRRKTHVSLLSAHVEKKSARRTGGAAARFVTRCTFQGDGIGPAVGIEVNEDTYVEQCVFVNLGGLAANDSKGWCPECSTAIRAVRGASVHAADSAFYEPVDARGSTYVRAEGNGTAALLTGCRFDDAPRQLLRVDGGRIYSDDSSRWVYVNSTNGNVSEPVLPLSALPDTPDGEAPVFLERDNEWFLRVHRALTGDAELPQELTGAPALAPVAVLQPLPFHNESWENESWANGGLGVNVTSRTDNSSHHSGLLGLAIGGAAAALVVLAMAVGLLLWWRQRRRRRRRRRDLLQRQIQGGGRTKERGDMPAWPAPARGPGLGPTGATSSGEVNSAIATGSSWGASAYTAQSQRSSTTFGAFNTAYGTVPGANADTATKLEFLNMQLASIGTDRVVLERFRLLGPSHRRQGGQGVVAFAQGAHDDLGYALKFFVHRGPFLVEREMYRCQALQRLLPRVYCEYDPEEKPSGLVDSHARPLPPCLAMERGEGLSDWSRRAKPDIFQAVAVLAHVAMRLRDLHAEGYVHRDVKPENIMFLPRENSWTVIDFGCTACAGAVVPLSYTLAYSAPEVAHAVFAGAKTIVADAALDAWAMGVVAYELLTRQSAFSLLMEGRESVLAKLRGEQELPWEGDFAMRNPTARRRLGLFRQPVLALLRRDPVQRATLAEFCRTADSVFSTPTTMVTSGPLHR